MAKTIFGNKKHTELPHEEQIKKDLKNFEDNHIFNKTPFTIICILTLFKKPKDFTEKITGGIGLAEICEANIGVERKKAENIDRAPERFVLEPHSTRRIEYKKSYIQKLEIFYYKKAGGEKELIQCKYLEAEREIFLINENLHVPTIFQAQKENKEMIPEVKSYLADLIQLQQAKPEVPEYVVPRDEIKLEDNVDTSDQDQQTNTEGNIEIRGNVQDNHDGDLGVFKDTTGKAVGKIIATNNKIVNSVGDTAKIISGAEASRLDHEQFLTKHQKHKEDKAREMLKGMLDQVNTDLKEVEGKIETEEDKPNPNNTRLKRFQTKIDGLEADKKELQSKLNKLLE